MSSYRIVDVCGTLVRDDTTLGLLSWHFRRSGGWRRWVSAALTARWSPLRLMVAVAERVTGRHLLKHMLVGWLAGEPMERLHTSATAYADWLLANRRVQGVETLLARSDGALVLASASLEPVVQALAFRLGARFVASTLEVHDGRYTGRYVRDLTGCKREALEALLGPDVLREALVISDNFTDRSLLALAAQACVVVHKARHRARWTGLDAEYLDLC